MCNYAKILNNLSKYYKSNYRNDIVSTDKHVIKIWQILEIIFTNIQQNDGIVVHL